MTDARFPERWLNDRRIMLLPDDAFRLFINSLIWSVANRTDGLIYDDDLPLIPGGHPVEIGPDLMPVPGPERHLVKTGLWERVKDYWLITVFADTQSSRDELDALAARRRADRERKAAERRRRSQDLSEGRSQDASRDSHAERLRPGQDRTGQAPKGDQVERTASGDEDEPPCAVPGCTRPARRACRTCDRPDHMRREFEFREPPEEMPF